MNKTLEKWLRPNPRKIWWRLRHNSSPNCTPVFICGAQRSGTSMLGRCLDQLEETDVFHESDPRAFDQFILRDDRTITGLIRSSPYRFAIFKPLTDSHRFDGLLQLHAPARGIWMYRWYQDRARSAVERFGSHNLEVLTALSRDPTLDMWQAKGISPQGFDTIRSFDYSRMSPHAAACLFWYLRNNMFFERNFNSRTDVMMLSYDKLVESPTPEMRALCSFIGSGYHPSTVRQIHSKSSRRDSKLDIPRALAELCEALYERLNDARTALIRRNMAANGAS